MSGDRILSIKHRWGVVNILDTVSAQEALKNFYDWIVANPSHFTLIASNFGSGGTGFDYHDGANPTGGDAFFVFSMPAHAGRTWTPYFLVQAAIGINLTNALPSAVGALPARLNGQTAHSGFGYIGVSCCVVTGGNPWNGGTAADGTDLKGDPVWVTPAAQTAWFFPRSIAAGGAYAASKEDTGVIMGKSGNTTHVGHFIADLDHLLFAWDDSENSIYEVSYFGKYVPSPNVTVEAPFVMKTVGLATASAAHENVDFGTTAPTTTSLEGGAAAPGGVTVTARHVIDETVINAAGFSPNDFHDGTDGRDRFAHWLYGNDISNGRGLLGHMADGEIACFVPRYLTGDDPDGTQSEVGFNANVIDWAWLVKWDGANSITGTDRNGVQATVVVP